MIDRDTAARLGITPQVIDDTLYDAFGQRQVSTMYTQLNQYHVVMEVAPRVLAEPRDAARHLRPVGERRAGAAQRLHPLRADAPRRWRSITRDSSRPITLSFNLAPGVALGDAVDGDRRPPSARSACRPASAAASQGTAQAFQASLANEPLLILAALVAVYIVLGMLYESYIHPLTILSTLPSAGVGALLALLLCRTDLSVIALDRHHPADRHREEERDHDDRLRARGRAHGGQAPGGGDLRGLPAALPADHDDDDGGAARRACRWRSGTGTGSELRRPLGIAIVGGLIVSQLLTLYTTPVVYLYLDRLRLWFARLRKRRPRQMLPAPQLRPGG